MLQKQIITTAATALLVASFLIPAAAQDKPVKIGYVDLKLAYEESGRKKEYDEKMKELEREKRMALSKLNGKIISMEQMKWALSDEKRKEKDQEIKELRLQFTTLKEDARKDLGGKAMEFEKEFSRDMKEVVTKIGDEEGYTYILSDLVLLYSDPKHDLTARVISMLKEKSSEAEGPDSSPKSEKEADKED